jgi:hypothetical protein
VNFVRFSVTGEALLFAMLLLFGGFALGLLISLRGFALPLGVSVDCFSLLLGGFFGLDSVFSDGTIFALGEGGEDPGG